LLLPSCAACGMGLLSFCLGSSSVAVQPEGTALAPGVRGNEMRVLGPPSVENADSLVSLLTQAQQMELQAGFRQFDVNGNGTIDAAELKSVMNQLGSPVTDDAVKDIITAMDLDHNGQVEWAEFACLMADRWLRSDEDTDMQLAVGLLASGSTDDARGMEEVEEINVERMRSLLCGSGEAPLNEDEWAQFLRVADPNGTGKVSTDAFKAMPCWAPPSAELLLSPRSAAKRRAEGAGGAGAPGGS